MPKIKTDLLKVKDSDGKWQYIPTVRSEGKSATNDESVLYVPQTLLDEQKRQARKNIGAVGADELEAAVSDKIDSPETAVIGEMLSVAEIDENGKPKKWKTEKVEISNVETDSTLTVSGKAADAKAVGDELKNKQPVGNYLTGESDPTVPAWAKQPNKPTYTADEVGALSKDTVIPTVPTALPNPNKLKFTGAVSAEYDGSNAVTVNIPNGGSGGNNDNSLGLTGVNVGDIPKVKAVDENGRPTEWEIANYGAGDSAGAYELLYEGEAQESTAEYSVDLASIGECKKLLFVIYLTKPESKVNLNNFIIYHNETQTKCDYYCAIDSSTASYPKMRLIYTIEHIADNLVCITRLIDLTLLGTNPDKAIYPGYQQPQHSLTTSIAVKHTNGFFINFSAEIPSISVTAYGVRDASNAIATTNNPD